MKNGTLSNASKAKCVHYSRQWKAGSWRRRVGLGGAGGGAWRAGRGLEGQRAGFGRAGLPTLKHRDVLGWS